MSLADHVGEYTRTIVDLTRSWTYDAMSEEEIRAAKISLLDTVACGIEGGLADPSRIAKQAALRRGGVADATILGTDRQVPIDTATRVNGVMIRSYDLNDTFAVALEVGDLPLQGSHPSEAIPAALAVAEREGVCGERFLASIGLSYELNARFVEMVAGTSLAERGFHHGTFAGLVVPPVGGYLMDLPREEIAHAIGMGATRATLNVIDTMSKRPNNATKSLAYPEAAAAAVHGTELAANGFTGPVSALEGYGGVLDIVYGDDPDVRKLSASGSQGYLRDTIRKRYPADATTQGTVHSVLTLVNDNKIDPPAITSIDVYTGTRCHLHTSDPERFFTINEETADHSLRYLCSVACLDGEVTTDQYRKERYRDEDVRSFADRLSFHVDENYDDTPQAGRVEIHLESGNTLTAETVYPPGSLENPLTPDAVEEKFRRYWAHRDSDRDADTVVDIIESLEDLEDVGELLNTLAVGG